MALLLQLITWWRLSKANGFGLFAGCLAGMLFAFLEKTGTFGTASDLMCQAVGGTVSPCDSSTVAVAGTVFVGTIVNSFVTHVIERHFPEVRALEGRLENALDIIPTAENSYPTGCNNQRTPYTISRNNINKQRSNP